MNLLNRLYFLFIYWHYKIKKIMQYFYYISSPTFAELEIVLLGGILYALEFRQALCVLQIIFELFLIGVVLLHLLERSFY